MRFEVFAEGVLDRLQGLQMRPWHIVALELERALFDTADYFV
jgi:hypothetical protein